MKLRIDHLFTLGINFNCHFQHRNKNRIKHSILRKYVKKIIILSNQKYELMIPSLTVLNIYMR